MTLRFGLHLPATEVSGLADIADPTEKCETIFRIAQKAESLGFDSIWLADHLHPTGATYFDCWTMIPALARETRSVTLGQMTTCVSFRSPALLAKSAACVDHMSKGRLIVGLGAGYAEPEHVAYGIDFGPGPGFRLARLKEAVQVIRLMWTEEHPTFHGTHYTIEDAMNEPKPWQKPHPPIWIAGGGEKVTLRIVAELADGCNVFGRPETVIRKLDALREHCQDLGRDYERITKSTTVALVIGDEKEQEEARQLAGFSNSRFAKAGAPLPGEFRGTAAGASDHIRRLVDCGITDFLLGGPLTVRDGWLERYREIAAAVA